jgi:hypothetical protein
MADEEHKTSLAIWDLDSPVVTGRIGRLKVGAKCSAGCVLTDNRAEIHDPTGTTVAWSNLSAEPWPGTTGLYWAELQFPAPPKTGTHAWTMTLAHGDAMSNFTFITVQPPEHTLTIAVRDKESQAALSGAEVRSGVYRAASDDRGFATIELPTGSYNLSVWKVGYDQFTMEMEISKSISVDVELGQEVEPEAKYWM